MNRVRDAAAVARAALLGPHGRGRLPRTARLRPHAARPAAALARRQQQEEEEDGVRSWLPFAFCRHNAADWSPRCQVTQTPPSLSRLLDMACLLRGWQQASAHGRGAAPPPGPRTEVSQSVSHRTSSATPTRVCSHEHVHTTEATSSLCGRLVMFEVIEGLVQVRWS